MLDKQIDVLRVLLVDSDLQKYAGDAFWNLIQAVVKEDVFAGVQAVDNIREIIFHVPTVLFWDKMKRFLLGSFKSFDDQVKMAEKFDKENSRYSAFIKRQIHLIDEVDDDLKIDYFAALTRCFLLTGLDECLYFKLAKIISICDSSELNFIKSFNYNQVSELTMTISLLYQNGLFIQHENDQGKIEYALSDLGKSLKQNSLNFDGRLQEENQICSLNDMTPLSIPIVGPWQIIDEMLET